TDNIDVSTDKSVLNEDNERTVEVRTILEEGALAAAVEEGAPVDVAERKTIEATSKHQQRFSTICALTEVRNGQDA
ncbi:MAG: hypothetical protein AAGJ35_13360, partial [Myxococcota bacterium]